MFSPSTDRDRSKKTITAITTQHLHRETHLERKYNMTTINNTLHLLTCLAIIIFNVIVLLHMDPTTNILYVVHGFSTSSLASTSKVRSHRMIISSSTGSSSSSIKQSSSPSRLFLIENTGSINSGDEDEDDDLIDSISFKKNQTTTTNELEKEKEEEQSSLQTSSNGSIRETLKNTIFLGIDPTPDVIAIATIYFVEGALGLARLAQTFLLKDELHLGPAELSALSGIFTLPWTVKPIYGFLSDGFPLFGYRRRSYLVLAGLTGCFSYSAVGNNFWGLLDNVNNGGGIGDDGSSTMVSYTIAALVLSSACIAVSDVVADGIVVQKTRESAKTDPSLAGGLQSLCWGSAAVGGLLSAYFSGSLLEVMKPQDVFSLTAILPLLVALIALLIDEEPLSKTNMSESNDDDATIMDTEATATATATTTINGAINGGEYKDDIDTTTITTITTTMANNNNNSNDFVDIQSQIDSLWSAIKQPAIYKPALFIFLWQSTPTSDGAMLFFQTEDLGFGPEFLGRVRLVAAFSSLFGIWLYNTYLKNKSIKDILFWASIISFPLGLLDLVLITHANRLVGIPDTWFVFGDDVVLSVLGEIAFLPTLVLAARICPIGVEAVLFAVSAVSFFFFLVAAAVV
jgi:folate/biopterin transporter